MFKNITVLFSFIIYFFLTSFLASNDIGAPTLLKKAPNKKEKFREEVLVTKKIDINSLYLKKYLDLELVKKIFPSATEFREIDKETLSSAIFSNNILLG